MANQAPTPMPPVSTGQGQVPQGYNSGTSYWSYGSRDPYDSRVGNGSLPQGFWGSQNRAYVRNTNPNELVSNQLNGLIDPSNPYIASAMARAREASNARGGLNSSIAAGSAQRAAIDAALPIAQGNAQAFQNTAQQNQQWLNQQQMAMEGNAAQLEAANSSAAAQLEAAKYGDNTRLQMQREQLAYGGEQQGLDRAFQDYMASRSYYNNLGLQNNQYSNQLRQSMFNLGGNMLMNNQNFGYNYALAALNNPALMNDPQAAGAYTDFWQNRYMPQLDALMYSVFGGSGFGGGYY